VQVGLGPGHIVLDRDPAPPPPKRGRRPQFSAHVYSGLDDWMDQDATWNGGRSRPKPHCARWGPSSPSPKVAQPPIFGPYLLWPNGWMDQDATWNGSRPQPRPHCVRRGPSSPPPRKGHCSPLFSAHVYCGHGRPSQLLLSSCNVNYKIAIICIKLSFIQCFGESYK